MDRIQDHIKILSTLSLASSDTREDTLSSVIIKTVQFAGKGVEKEHLVEDIKEHFQFEPYKSELNTITQKLIEKGELILDKGLLTLSADKAAEIRENDLALTDNDKRRFQNFKSFIQDDLESKIEISEIKLLYEHFLNYIYNCFYEYGQEALKNLHPHIEFENDEGFENIAQKAIEQLRVDHPELTGTFQKAIELFPSYASEEDLGFLVELAQKTSSFSSLGIDPSLLSSGLDSELIDWTLYLDTNVLYSLLDLHSHPESEACKALVQLIHDNSEIIKINLRYSEFTYKELRNKQQDFDLLDAKLSSPAITALLKSGKVDDFTEQFYTKLLSDPNTLHPSEIIDISQTQLESEAIKIGRNAKRVEQIGEEYINVEINNFYRFIEDKNAVRKEFCENKKIPFHPVSKSEAQVKHDIILREILRDSRSLKKGKVLTMNNVKFFGLTLDSMLIDYDRSKVKDYNDEDSYPIFFKPSFLLNRLTRILPVQTKNYKKAFVKAITTKGFHRNSQKSRDVLRLAIHLKKLGIDNTDVIYNLISEDLFLEKLRANRDSETFDQTEFISSEINRQFNEAQNQLEDAKSNLADTIVQKENTDEQNQKLERDRAEAAIMVKQYETALKTLHGKIKKVEKQAGNASQVSLDFQGESEKRDLSDANVKLKRQLKSELEESVDVYKRKALSKWQTVIWWNLFWVIPLLTFACMLLIPNKIFHIPENEENKRLLDVIFLIISAILTLLFGWLTQYRYLNETAKAQKMDNIKIPAYLKDKMENLKTMI